MRRVFCHRSTSNFSGPAHPRHTPFSRKHTANSMLALFVFMGSVPMAFASRWYVNRAHGSDNNGCKSRQHACKTIGHAISLASSGDSILIASGRYTENLTIGVSLRIVGSGPNITVIDGGGVSTVVTIPNSGTQVTLSRLNISNGLAVDGGGIYNSGALTIWNSIINANTLGSCILKY